MQKEQQILSPAEWQSVSNRVVELSRRAAEASSQEARTDNTRKTQDCPSESRKD
jgi:hypothetical protein